MSSQTGSRPASVSYAGSHATGATVTSEMSMQYRNRKVMNNLNAWYYGSGRYPFKVAVICFVIGFLIFFAGVVLLGLIFGQRQLDIGNWWGNIIAAGLIVGGILVFALGVKFLFDARRKSTIDRKKLAFRPTGLTKVSVVNNAYESERGSTYKTKSGTSSIKAVNSPYASSVGSRSHATHSIARTGDSLPSLDNRPVGYSSNPRPQGRYQQNLGVRPDDRRYHDESRGAGDNRSHTSERRSLDNGRYDERPRQEERRGLDDRRGYDDRRDNRQQPPSRSASRDFDDVPLDDHTYI